MAALSIDFYISRTKVGRALDLTLEFELGSNLNVDRSSFEYANWVINGGGPSKWLPSRFERRYLG